MMSIQMLIKALSNQGVPSAASWKMPFKWVHKSICVSGKQMYVFINASTSNKHLIIKSLSEASPSKDMWLLICDFGVNVEDYFTNVNIPFDCQFLVAQPEGDHVVLLTEVYRVSATLPLQTYPIGNWTGREKLKCLTSTFYRRRNNLQEHIIRATYADRFFILSVDNDTYGLPKPNGYFGQVWGTIADIVNATTVYKETLSYGFENKDGSWTGMMGEVMSGRADVGLGDFMITIQRGRVVDFLGKVDASRIAIFIRKSRRTVLALNRYLKPFDSYLWWSVVGAVCALSCCLVFTSWYCRKQINSVRISAVRSLFYILGCLCQQGQMNVVQSNAGSMVSFTTYLTCLVLYAGYSASLISSLTVQVDKQPFVDLQGLLIDGSYDVGILNDSAGISIFKDGITALEQEVYHKLILPHLNDMPGNVSDGFSRLCSRNNYALIAPYISGNYYSKQHCSVTTLPGTYYPRDLSFIISKNSPFKKILNWNLARLREYGIIDRIRQHNIPRSLSDTPDSLKSVNLYAVASVLLLYAFGIVISACVLLCELCIHKISTCIVKTNI